MSSLWSGVVFADASAGVYAGAYRSFEECRAEGERFNGTPYQCLPDQNDGRPVYELYIG